MKIAQLYKETSSRVSFPNTERKRIFQTSYTQPKPPRAHLDIIREDFYFIILG